MANAKRQTTVRSHLLEVVLKFSNFVLEAEIFLLDLQERHLCLLDGLHRPLGQQVTLLFQLKQNECKDVSR